MADHPQVNDEAALLLFRTSRLLLFFVRKSPNRCKAITQLELFLEG